MKTQIAFNASTKVVKLQMPGDAEGEDFSDLGDVDHPSAADPLGSTVNHVLYHHIRDEMYKLGELNMQIITITDTPVTALSSLPATSAKAPAATQQMTLTFTPATANNRYVTYTSSDEEVATVDDTGLITAVAAGVATITVTAMSGGFSDTCVITVA